MGIVDRTSCSGNAPKDDDVAVISRRIWEASIDQAVATLVERCRSTISGVPTQHTIIEEEFCVNVVEPGLGRYQGKEIREVASHAISSAGQDPFRQKVSAGKAAVVAGSAIVSL